MAHVNVFGHLNLDLSYGRTLRFQVVPTFLSSNYQHVPQCSSGLESKLRYIETHNEGQLVAVQVPMCLPKDVRLKCDFGDLKVEH